MGNARAFSSGRYRLCDGCVSSALEPLRFFSDGCRSKRQGVHRSQGGSVGAPSAGAGANRWVFR